MKNINIKKGFPVFTENPVVGGPYELRSFVLKEVIYVMFLTSLRNIWAIRPLTLPFGLVEVIKFNFLTSLRKLWAIRTTFVCPSGSDIRIVSHFVAKLLGHTSAYATVCPQGSD